MKRCPQCSRTYEDDTQNFCLEDGEWLLESGPNDEPTTAILADSDLLSDAATRQQIINTGKTENPEVPKSTPVLDRNGIRKNRLVIGAVSVSIIVATIGAWIFVSYGGGKTANLISLQSAKFTRLTNTGQIAGGALSPDGKYLAQVVDDGDQQSLWLKQTAASSNVQIVPPAEVSYSGVSFAPDGNHIYYSVYQNEDAGTLYQIPVLGGQPRKLLTNIHSGPAFSPDGSRMAFFRIHPSGTSEALILAKSDGTGERELAVRTGGEEFSQGLFATVSWSPDGKLIATPIRNVPENYLTVATVSVETGELKPVTTHKWFRVGQVAWLPDGESVLIAGARRSGDASQIWQVLPASGEVKQLTNDLNGFLGVGLTADGETIAAVQTDRLANIWVAPSGNPTDARSMTSGRTFQRDAVFTPDGKLVYSSYEGGNWDIFIKGENETEARQLTTDGMTDQFPAVTPDGRYVVFMSDRTGPPHIWRMNIDGSNQTQLTQTGYNIRPQITPDGATILYESSQGKGWSVWKIPVDGGQPVPLNEIFAVYPAISRDGKLIAANYSPEANTTLKLGIFSAETGQLIKVFDSNFTDRENNLDWTADSKAVVYRLTKKEVGNLWVQPVSGGPPKQITNFTTERIFGFKYSLDGKQLALSRGIVKRDVVLITNFK